MEKNRIVAIKLVKLFIRFLKSENILEQYIQNSKLGITKKHSSRNKYTFNINTKVHSKATIIDKALHFVSSAFTWSKTEEGWEFWCSANLKWRDLLRKYVENLY